MPIYGLPIGVCPGWVTTACLIRNYPTHMTSSSSMLTYHVSSFSNPPAGLYQTTLQHCLQAADCHPDSMTFHYFTSNHIITQPLTLTGLIELIRNDPALLFIEHITNRPQFLIGQRNEGQLT